MLTVLDENWDLKETMMFTDRCPQVATTGTRERERICQADQEATQLSRDARRAQWDADCLSLARDVAMLGSLYKEVSKSEQAARTSKILHLKNQNTIGASIVKDFMQRYESIHSGPPRDQATLIEQAGL